MTDVLGRGVAVGGTVVRGRGVAVAGRVAATVPAIVVRVGVAVGRRVMVADWRGRGVAVTVSVGVTDCRGRRVAVDVGVGV